MLSQQGPRLPFSSSLFSAILLAFFCSPCHAFLGPAPLALRSASVPAMKRSARSVRHAAQALNMVSSSNMVTSSDRLASIPWEKSVAGDDLRLLYMPFVEYQMQFMKEKYPDMKDLPLEEHLSYQSSDKKPAIIESWQFETEQFRKIRLTYIDAGMGAQVYNSVWYPRHCYDAPILGLDFLSFGPKKVLAICDLQPLTQDEDYLKKYIDPLIPLRNKYEDLCGRMSGKFYEETQFFSKQLLFGRFDNDKPVMESLYPAFKDYLEYYTSMIDGLTPDKSPEFEEKVAELHKAYDVYSAEKDPAVGLFSTYWGKDWAEDFTHNFLFSESEPPKEE